MNSLIFVMQQMVGNIVILAQCSYSHAGILHFSSVYICQGLNHLLCLHSDFVYLKEYLTSYVLWVLFF